MRTSNIYSGKDNLSIMDNAVNFGNGFCVGKTYNYIILTMLLITGCLLSAFIKGENITDFANYHYYIAYAFANNAFNDYLVPGGANTFLNPLIELPLYFFIKYFNDYPLFVYALQGIWYGLSLIFLYKICVLFIAPKSIKELVLIFLILGLATVRQAIWIQIGTSTNEIPMLFFDLWGLYILFSMLKNPQLQNIKKFMLAGIILGIGLGLKETSLHVCLASGLMLIICHKLLEKPVVKICCFALGGIIGFFIINGYFMLHLYMEYGNPVFPFFNNIFKSEYAPAIPFQDTRLSFELYHIFIPYFFYVIPNALCAFGLKDYIITVGYVFLLIYFSFVIYNKCLKYKNINDTMLLFLSVFLICDWFIWGSFFYIIRYLVVYSALIPLFITLVIKKIYHTEKITNILLLVYCVILLLSSPFNYLGVKYRENMDKYLDIEKIELPENSLIKFYGPITSFLIPHLASNNTFKSVSYYPKCFDNYCGFFGIGSDFVENFKFRQIRDDIEKTHKGPVVYMYNSDFVDLTKNEDAYETENKLMTRSYLLNIISKQRYQKNWNIYRAAKEFVKLRQDIKDNFYCRAIKNNMDISVHICVPNEYKNYIIKSNKTPEKIDE